MTHWKKAALLLGLLVFVDVVRSIEVFMARAPMPSGDQPGIDSCPLQCDLLFPPNTADLRNANDNCKKGCSMAASLISPRYETDPTGRPAKPEVDIQRKCERLCGEQFSGNLILATACSRDCIEQNFAPPNAMVPEEGDDEAQGAPGDFFRNLFSRDWVKFFRPRFWADVQVAAPPMAAVDVDNANPELPLPPESTQFLAEHRRVVDLIMKLFEPFGLSPRPQDSSENLPPIEDVNDVVVEAVQMPAKDGPEPEPLPIDDKQQESMNPVILFRTFKKSVVGPRYPLDSDPEEEEMSKETAEKPAEHQPSVNSPGSTYLISNFGLMECFVQRARNLTVFTKLLMYSALILCSACLIWIGTLFLRSGFRRRNVKKEPRKSEVIYCVPSPYYFEKCPPEKMQPPTTGGPPGYCSDNSSDGASSPEKTAVTV